MRSAIAAILPLLTATAASAQDPTLEIFDPPAECAAAAALDINADGTVFVGEARCGGVSLGFVWTETSGFEVIAETNMLLAVDAAGDTALSSSSHVWERDNGVTPTELTLIVEGTGISSEGSTFVGRSAHDFQPGAALWHSGSSLELIPDTLDGIDFTYPFGNSPSADTVVGLGFLPEDGIGTGIVWNRDRGGTALGPAAWPKSVSADEQVVVGQLRTEHAELLFSSPGAVFRWTPRGGLIHGEPLVIETPTLPIVTDTTANAAVAIGFLDRPPNWTLRDNAFIWDRVNGARRMSEYLADFGTTLPADVEWWSGYGITPDGRTIAGTMITAQGVSSAFRLQLPPACRNGLDDDLDGLVDFPQDPGCANADGDEGLRNDIPFEARRIRVNRKRARAVIYGVAYARATEHDVSSMRVGRGDAPVIRHRVRDIDRDGEDDLRIEFDPRDAGVRLGDDELCIRGDLPGEDFESCSPLRTFRRRALADSKHKRRSRKDARGRKSRKGPPKAAPRGGSDLTSLYAAFGSSQGDDNFNASIDCNNDGAIDGSDFSFFLANHAEAHDLSGLSCPATIPDVVRSPREFRVCVFGDTQNYARTWHVPDIKASYTSMAQYAADGNCDAVIHMGDMTDNHGGTHEDDQSMWDANYEALAPIFAAGIPFSPSQGNHDLPSQYELLVDAVNDTSRPFEAVSSSKRSHSLIQKVGGVDQLIISVGCGWAQDEYDFMKDQIATHPGIPTLVHSHISTYGRQVPSFSFSDPIFDSARCPQSHGGTQRPTDQEITDYFRATEQIYVLAGGHWTGFSVGMDSVRNSNHPHPLFLIMENFQNIAGGGDGWFGLLTIDQDSGTARYEHYNAKKDAWIGLGDDLGARSEHDFKWKARGFAQSSGEKIAHVRPNLDSPGGYLAIDDCYASYFMKDGWNGGNNCKTSLESPYPYELALNRVQWGAYFANAGHLLPWGTAPGSSAMALIHSSVTGYQRVGPSAVGRKFYNYRTGFSCFWMRGPPSIESGNRYYRWLSNLNLNTGRGFDIRTVYGDSQVLDGTTRFTVGNTSFYAKPGLEAGLHEYQHVCMGWDRDVATRLYQIAATINGVDACPVNGCPNVSDNPRSNYSLTVGVPSGIPDPRAATSGANTLMHELIFIANRTLTPDKARWITACGAEDDASASYRKNFYLDGSVGAIEGPNGETSCSTP